MKLLRSIRLRSQGPVALGLSVEWRKMGRHFRVTGCDPSEPFFFFTTLPEERDKMQRFDRRFVLRVPLMSSVRSISRGSYRRDSKSHTGRAAPSLLNTI